MRLGRVVFLACLLGTIVAGTAAYDAPCEYEASSDATYDLSELRYAATRAWNRLYKAIDTTSPSVGSTPTAAHAEIVFNVCNKVANPPLQCQGGNFPQGGSYAYLLHNRQCDALGSRAKWSMVDENVPTRGVKLSYSDGSKCGTDDKFQLDIVFRCESISGRGELMESLVQRKSPCRYQIEYATMHGCPTQCPVSKGSLCSGHGSCEMSLTGKPQCECTGGYSGDDCSFLSSDANTGNLNAPVSMPCKYSSGGATFDLHAFTKDNGASPYRINGAGSDEYQYEFNVCAPVTTLPGVCRDKKVSAGNAAYQIREGGKRPICKNIAGQIHRGHYKWSLLDSADPSKGVQLSYTHGATCSKGGEREFTVKLRCGAVGGAPMFEKLVREVAHCKYEVETESMYACPKECPIVNGKLCGGHGTCAYDERKRQPLCDCETGYEGSACTKVSSASLARPGRMSCKLRISDVVEYDLTKLQLPYGQHAVLASSPSGQKDKFVFNICGVVHDIPASCKARKYGKYAAFQLVNFADSEKEKCYYVAGASPADGKLSMVDESDASKGVQISYADGKACHSTGKPRRTTFVVTCGPGGSDGPKITATEPSKCEYEIKLESPHGCPLQCVSSDGAVCSGHGKCSGDGGGVATCKCASGYAGDRCEMKEDKPLSGENTCVHSDKKLGVTYNLAKLKRTKGENYVAECVHKGGRYQFDFNICAPVVKIPESCRKKNYGPFPVFQSNDKMCKFAANQGPNMVAWEVLSETDPTKGVALTYKGGRACSDGNNRQTTIKVLCSEDVEATVYKAREVSKCKYEILMDSIYGCPTVCYSPTTGRICDGHGDCVHDPKKSSTGCLCDRGYTGRFCSYRDKSVPVGPTPERRRHHHEVSDFKVLRPTTKRCSEKGGGECTSGPCCNTDTCQFKVAGEPCFAGSGSSTRGLCAANGVCYAGHLGGQLFTATKSPGAGGSGGDEGGNAGLFVFLVLALAAGVGFAVYKKNQRPEYELMTYSGQHMADEAEEHEASIDLPDPSEFDDDNALAAMDEELGVQGGRAHASDDDFNPRSDGNVSSNSGGNDKSSRRARRQKRAQKNA